MICASQLANLYGFSRVRAVVHAHTCTASHPLAVLRPRPSLAPVKFCLSKKMTTAVCTRTTDDQGRSKFAFDCVFTPLLPRL